MTSRWLTLFCLTSQLALKFYWFKIVFKWLHLQLLWHLGASFVDVCVIDRTEVGCFLLSTLLGRWASHDPLVGLTLLVQWTWKYTHLSGGTQGHSRKHKKISSVVSFDKTFTYCFFLQCYSTQRTATEGQAGRLFRQAGRSDSGLQWESSQRAEAQSRHQALGQTGEQDWAPSCSSDKQR